MSDLVLRQSTDTAEKAAQVPELEVFHGYVKLGWVLNQLSNLTHQSSASATISLAHYHIYHLGLSYLEPKEHC